MSDSVSYTPPDVPPALAAAHRYAFAGRIFSQIFYGLTIAVFANCVSVLGPQAFNHRTPALRAKRLQLAYSCAIFLCGTIFIACDTFENTVSTLDYPLYPGGSFAWAMEHYNHPVIILGNFSFVLTTWLADGFMLYRSFVLYSSIMYVVALPALVYLASIATGILLLVQISQPSESVFSQVNFGLAYFSTTAALNMLITAMISGRLIYHRLRMQKAMSLETHSLRTYVSLTSILVESSALYAVFFFLFIIPFSLDHPVAKFFLPLIAQVQVICPLLVTYRVSQQRAWTTATTNNMSSGGTQVVFALRATGGASTGGDSKTFTTSADRTVTGSGVHYTIGKEVSEY